MSFQSTSESAPLSAAQDSFRSKKYESALIEVRKAIFLRLESNCDVSAYMSDEPVGILRKLSTTRYAPEWAKNREYVTVHVKDPCDFVVIDRAAFDLHLIQAGMDPIVYWNINRLTPAVFRDYESKEWTVRREFSKVDPDGIKERAEYVIDGAITMFAAADRRASEVRTPSNAKWRAQLNRDNVAIYQKASTNSDIDGVTPDGLREITVEATVRGIDSDEIFWRAVVITDDFYADGYVLASDIEDEA